MSFPRRPVIELPRVNRGLLGTLTGSDLSPLASDFTVLWLVDGQRTAGTLFPFSQPQPGFQYLNASNSMVSERGRDWFSGHNSNPGLEQYWYSIPPVVSDPLFNPYVQYITYVQVSIWRDVTDGVNLLWVGGRAEGAAMYRDGGTEVFDRGVTGGQPLKSFSGNNFVTALEFGGNNSVLGPSGKTNGEYESAFDQWYGQEQSAKGNPVRVAGKICMAAHRYLRTGNQGLTSFSEDGNIFVHNNASTLGLPGENGWSAYDPVQAFPRLVMGGRIALSTSGGETLYGIYGIPNYARLGVSLCIYSNTRFLTDTELYVFLRQIVRGVRLRV